MLQDFYLLIAPHSTTGISPTVMMFNRPLRCRLDLLKPNIEKTAQGQQIQQQLSIPKIESFRLRTQSLLRILVMDLNG